MKKNFFLFGVLSLAAAASVWAADPAPAGTPPKAAESPAAPAVITGGAATVAAAPVESGLDKSIFLDLRDINVVDILKFLALQGNLNIVTSKNVQGRSTLVLRNVKIKDALDIIVISNQLAYEVRNDIIYVMPEEEYVTVYGKNYNDKRKIATRTLTYAKPAYAITALQAVQSSVGKVLVDEDTGNVVMIDTPEKLLQMNSVLEDMEKKLDTKVITLQNAAAKDIETQLKLKLDAKSVGSVVADERSNQLTISAYPGRLEEILKVIKSLDKPKSAILLEVRILQLTLKPSLDYGIDWTRVFSNQDLGKISKLTFTGRFPIDSTVSSATNLRTVGRLAIGNATADDYTVEIKALKEVSDTKILANPRIMALDGQEAKINIGDRVPYVITTTTGTGNNVSVSEDIKFIDIGLLLIVKPQINDDGFITMKIQPEISSRSGTLVTPTNNQIPLVNTTKLDSSVVVKDGQTMILGGLRRDDYTVTNNGLPVLMDIPFMGHLFKNRKEVYTKLEIVTLITPKIVRGDKSVLDEPLPIKKDFNSESGRGVSLAPVLSPSDDSDAMGPRIKPAGMKSPPGAVL